MKLRSCGQHETGRKGRDSERKQPRSMRQSGATHCWHHPPHRFRGETRTCEASRARRGPLHGAGARGCARPPTNQPLTRRTENDRDQRIRARNAERFGVNDSAAPGVQAGQHCAGRRGSGRVVPRRCSHFAGRERLKLRERRVDVPPARRGNDCNGAGSGSARCAWSCGAAQQLLLLLLPLLLTLLVERVARVVGARAVAQRRHVLPAELARLAHDV